MKNEHVIFGLKDVDSIRNMFLSLWLHNKDAEILETINATFFANESSIFGERNVEYIAKELDWYNSASRNILNLDDPNRIPKIWKKVSSINNEVNSNYGWCIYSTKNGKQYAYAIKELLHNPDSRRATMIYTRPSMHTDYCIDGMNDFICTNTVQLFIRDNKLIYIVNMRSNDVVFGYNNDWAWHSRVHDKALDELKSVYSKLELGDIIWNANSLHVYKRHYHLIEEYRDVYSNSNT